MPISVSTKASHFPISLEEAKEHLRVTDTNSDSYIQGLIAAVTQEVEDYTGRTLITTQYSWKMDCFPNSYELYVPKGPLQAVSSITYIDTDESTDTWGSTYYSYDTVSMPGRIYPAYQETWPVTLDIQNAVTVTYTAGQSSHMGGVPEMLKMAMKWKIHDYWFGRSGSAAQSTVSDSVLTQFKIPSFEGY